MWTKESRARYDRSALRYPSDLTRWRMGDPCAVDPAGQARRPSARGRYPCGDWRAALRAGDRLPVAPPAQGLPAQEHGAQLFRAVGLGRHAGANSRCPLCRLARARGPRGQPFGRHSRQPERQIGAKRGPSIDPVGFDAGKKVKGIKRHILTDHQGLLLAAVVHAASVQDRDGAALVLTKRVRRRFAFITTIFADAGYQGPRVRRGGPPLRPLAHRDRQAFRSATGGFVVQAKRWIVERTLAWISRNRRLARDFENLARTAEPSSTSP